MSKNLYLAGTEKRSGKSAIALGVMQMLLRNLESVAFFRPIIREKLTETSYPDHDLYLIHSHYELTTSYAEMYAYTFQEARSLIQNGKQDELLEGILTKYKSLEEKHDFVLCEGTDFESVTASFEFNINADIALNLACPVLLITRAIENQNQEVVESTHLAIESFLEKGCQVLGVIINRVKEAQHENLFKLLVEKLSNQYLTYAIPEFPMLGKPTMREIAEWMSAKVLYGEHRLDKQADHIAIGAMQIRNFMQNVQTGSLVITAGDRADVILASLLALSSSNAMHVAGILLTGGLHPEKGIVQLIEGMVECPIPILLVDQNTYETCLQLSLLHAHIEPENKSKIAASLGHFERYVNTDQLRERIIDSKSLKVTPKMFEYRLVKQAKSKIKHIVLPEGEDERIIQAAEILNRRGVAKISLLGNIGEIQQKLNKLGIALSGIEIIDPLSSPLLEDYVQTYFDMRKHKGITLEMARDIMSDVSYFGTMMVHQGHADGMVSGAVHTTQATIRPAFEIIKTKPNCSIVSSIFFMCLADRVLVYGDCAVNPNPPAQKLAEIAITSAETAQTFGVEPKVALLSYSTGASGKGEDVEKVRSAWEIATEMQPDLLLEGPIQYDAAIDPSVAKTKMPNSKVAGQATVFIFPDLNTGNNTYKAVQRSAKAVAIGPILQGLNQPVNDLSRGCTVTDIVNTVIITAIQAQQEA